MQKEMLENKIREAAHAYYNTAMPTMEDAEYDALVERLAAIDPSNPLFKKVGARPLGVFCKLKVPAGSQEKLQDKKAFDRWMALAREQGCRRFGMGWKLDGLTLVCEYEDGLLARALLRGDGHEGEDITVNACEMQNVKCALPVRFSGSLRGEMILSKSDFAEHFAPLGYTTPRNTASGVSRDMKGTGRFRGISRKDCPS